MTPSPDTANDSTLRPQLTAHDGSCGSRRPTPCGVTLGPFQPAETLRNGDTLCHLCSTRYRPHELRLAACCGRRTAA